MVLAQADTGDVPGGLETIRSRGSDDWKSEALAGVVDIPVRRGEFRRAVVTASAIPRPDIAGESRYSIAARQARERDAAAALEWASHLESPDRKHLPLSASPKGSPCIKPMRENRTSQAVTAGPLLFRAGRQGWSGPGSWLV